MMHVTGQFVPVVKDSWGDTCEDHPELKATYRLVGEADSFGCEYINMCDACYKAYLKAKETIANDESQWETCRCGRRQPELRTYRDPEEGMSGPVYHECDTCYKRVMDAFCADEEDYDDDVYEPEPHYEDIVKEELQTIVNYLKREYDLEFVIKDRASNKIGSPDLSIVLEVKGKKAYQRINKRFKSFMERGLDNGLVDVKELKEAICSTADDIEVIILNRRISDRKIEGSKNTPALSMGEIIRLAQDKKRIKNKLSKEFVTPIYSIELMFCRVNWS